ncbi:histone-lysine N-methyltransferase NSD2 isoform X1 [Thunnus maccoyii]|uniref:histone-lysine N-methyltransferase NSD2 isoform X1 n=1 Tax=Thunnus maccoyii TaxID=8240 RepID=UPI001C4BA301|nr:histone-lysine N-methyltransferase NSD2 isoform X1 [Thunnus maccoyii]XP_042244941.1 histone-lysine N-methyltransferase NSD2 isoform X1 [Thunnus maccoyii]
MDSKGSSLPSMPEPANPISMKQPPESLSVRKGRGDMGSDPALLMDKAAAQLAATLQDGVLQKMAGHSHNNHERLKDLTSRVLNGDQDALPKLCAPEPPMLKGAEAPATNGTHQHNCTPHTEPEPELKVMIPQVVKQPLFEPCCASGTSLSTATEGIISGPERQDVKKRRGRPNKPKPQSSLSPSATPVESLDHTFTVEGAGAAADELDLIPELTEEITEVSPLLIRFSVGDVVWTKVSGYPWWPCIVTMDPELNNHIKQKQKAANSRSGLLYHVQYFGDAPERGYIFEKNIVSFTGEDQYQELSQANKQPASRVIHKKTAPSVPRKLQAQWNMGIIQAKEALGMSLDERMTNFTYLYDDDGPHLNPHILEKLVPEPGSETDQETESRLSPELPSTLSGPAGEPTAAPQSQDSTSAGKKTQVPRTKLKMGEWRKGGKSHLNNSLSKKDINDTVSSKEMFQLQSASQDPATSAPDIPAESVVPPKKKRRPKQAQSPTKTVRRRKKPPTDNASDPANKRKTKIDSLNDNISEPVSLPVSVPVKRERKKTSKRPLTDASADKEQQPKKRRKTNKNAEKQASTSEGTDKKQRRRKKTDKDVKETKKRLKKSKAPLTDDQDAEKPKRRWKRKQDGENQVTPSKAKKRRSSPCPEPEGSGSEGRPDSPSDSLDGIKKGERKKEFVCQVCEQAGEDLVPCEGQCCGMFHLNCLGPSLKPEDKLLCQECSTGVHSCFTCKQSEGEVRRCHVPHCGKFYHEACVRLSPLTVFDNKGFRCPLHTCLSCHYGCRTKHKSSKGRLMRCLRCPVAYHVGDQCVAAGSEMITNTAIICTNHFHAKKGYSHHSHVNVSWCFVCSKGGQLLCCESCPAAFHPDCLNIAMPDGSWFCNDCRAGKKPKYRDIIWVKLGTYRWWPAEIHHPRNIPTNIQHLRHEIGEFPVFFFGSKDYFWTHQGRVFPYMEGDRGSKHQRTGIGKVFKNALLEAEVRFKEIKLKREAKEAQENNRKPPPYKFIKVNKPYGRVQVYTADIFEIPKCNCKPTDERPCGFESECLNRMLQYECHPQVCPSGERCCNQDFTKRLYPETKIIKTAGKGWGLVSLRDIKKGEFVNEYIGELIDEEECRARIKYAQENNITDFYMLTIDKDRIIDAGPKGNYSRFMNHSCQPNCETQKWTVNGDTRVGLFAVCDIPAGTELTFNYNLDCLGNEKTVCRCGAPNCSGFLGDRPKNSNGQTADPKGKRLKRKYKKRRAEGKKKSEDECFRCGDGGQLVLCDKKTCTKAYHLSCLNLTKRPFGRWDCPWHHCDVCGKNSEAFCQLCPNSFCKAHQEGALRPWPPTGQPCCQEHDELEGTDNQDQDDTSETKVTAATAVGGRPPKGSRKAEGAEAKTKGSKRKAAEA